MTGSPAFLRVMTPPIAAINQLGRLSDATGTAPALLRGLSLRLSNCFR
jgi:hypothetical protein